MTLRKAGVFAVLMATMVLGGCAYGVQDVRQNLGRILAARTPLPAQERFALPAAHRTAPHELSSSLATRQPPACSDSAPSAAREDSVKIVEEGDTLSGIARRVYGDYSYAEVLARENQLTNPDLIYPGQAIRLPASAAHCGRERAAYLNLDAPPSGARLSRRAFSSPTQRQPELRNVLASADDRERVARRP